jgi:hypothetical protein
MNNIKSKKVLNFSLLELEIGFLDFWIEPQKLKKRLIFHFWISKLVKSQKVCKIVKSITHFLNFKILTFFFLINRFFS